MDIIRQWTIVISSVTIISGVLISLLPENSHKNLYKTIVGIVLLYAFIQPFTGGYNIDFKVIDYISDNYKVSENIDKYALSSMINSAENSIEKLLAQEATNKSIECTFTCKCAVENEQIVVKKIIIENLQPQSHQTIIDIAETFGFSGNIIEFAGVSQ